MKEETGRRQTSRQSVAKVVRTTPKVALIVVHNARVSALGGKDYNTAEYFSLCLDLLVFGGLAFLGTMYLHNCTFKIPLWLMILGYTNCALSLLRFFLPTIGTCVQCCFNLAMSGYGGWLVFGNYEVWQTKDAHGPGYCAPMAFLSAFVFEIVLLIWFASVLLITLVVILILCCKGSEVEEKSQDIVERGDVVYMTSDELRDLQKRLNLKRLSRRISGASKSRNWRGVQRSASQANKRLETIVHKPPRTIKGEVKQNRESKGPPPSDASSSSSKVSKTHK
jgi:hypothetical protein